MGGEERDSSPLSPVNRPSSRIFCSIAWRSGGIEAAATISRAERRAAQSALTKNLRMRQAAELAAVVALDGPPMILAALPAA
jgi:hypothetical protein